MDQVKRCPRCELTKPVEEFHRCHSKKFGRQDYCKLCVLAASKRYYRNPEACERIKARRREYSKRPDVIARERSRSLSKRGITAIIYDSLLEQQGGVCAICGGSPTGRGQAHGIFFVDHDHVNGTVRGLLCHHCNVGIGHFRDDVAVLLKAIEYVEEHRAATKEAI